MLWSAIDFGRGNEKTSGDVMVGVQQVEDRMMPVVMEGHVGML